MSDPDIDSGYIASPKWEPELDDFEFFVPLDCPTSTPVASRKRCSKEGLEDSHWVPEPASPLSKPGVLGALDNARWTHAGRDSLEVKPSWEGVERGSVK